MIDHLFPVWIHNGQLYSEGFWDNEKEMRRQFFLSGIALQGFIKFSKAGLTWHLLNVETPYGGDWYFVLQHDKLGRYHVESNGDEDWFYNQFSHGREDDDFDVLILEAKGKNYSHTNMSSLLDETKADGLI